MKQPITFNLNYTMYVKPDARGLKRISAHLKAYGYNPWRIADLKRAMSKDGYLPMQGHVFVAALGGPEMRFGQAGFDMNVRLEPDGLILTD